MTKKILIYYLLSFFLGGILFMYLTFVALLESSVSRVRLLSSFIVNDVKNNKESSAGNILAVLYDDADFYTSYRYLSPSFISDSTDKIFCMSFRINPSSHDEKDYFSLINSKELEKLVINKAQFCRGKRK